MDLKALTYFIAVYEKKSISAAAKACFIAQPSISSAIKQLEETLENQLFTRHARGVVATEAGERLYPLAKQLLGQADAIKSVFAQKSHTLPFRLGLVGALGVDRMSLLLKDFTSKIDGMELTLVGEEEECDGRIVTERYVKESETFVAMWQDNYVLAIPGNHKLRFKQTITLNDFHGLSLIQRTPCEAWDRLTEILRQNEIEPVIRAKIHTLEYALGMVCAGVGCALLPDVPQIMRADDVVYLTIEGFDMSRRIGLAYEQSSEPLEVLKTLALKRQSAI
jgi:DNA-binding transcriptional LysR family regulator